MKTFTIPPFYRSPLISAMKEKRRKDDKLKKNLQPTVLSFGPIEFYIARHFGFCYGVENAIEIAFKTVEENPNKRIFLLSEMIHNPQVNADLMQHGVGFIMDTQGKLLVDWSTLHAKDIVIIPAFGTTLETEEKLRSIGIEPKQYNTTCPFVEKVWNRSEQIGLKGYTILIHGKPSHEETRATFSHSSSTTPSLILKDMDDALRLAPYIQKTTEDVSAFYNDFKGQYSEGFDVEKDLQKIGVVNQTTMLASETQAIADFIKNTIAKRDASSTEAFADTRDTLCYATNDNQNAVIAMLEQNADLALVIGGHNSSNTTHLVELCEKKLPTFFIENEHSIQQNNTIQHFDIHRQIVITSEKFLPSSNPVKILLTCGASCPDAIVERVINKILVSFPQAKKIEAILHELESTA
jgi:4-hydroxy-3-methylbut-2-enyl diphosphate reductase